MNSKRSSRKAGTEFTLTQLGRGCWIVGYRGRIIAGAVLTSLPAAAAYAAELAKAIGRHSFLLTVVDGGGRAI